MPIKPYLKTIERKLQDGQATEHTHRPALQTLLETLSPGLTVINEPRRIACGAPDLLVSRDGLTIGYLETKDVGVSLDEAERSEQLRRYRRSLENLVLTDYLEFRWYVDGDLRQAARLGRWDGKKVAPDRPGQEAVRHLLDDFLAHAPQEVNSPRELAERMARLTHLIRDVIVETFQQGQASPLLQGWRAAFAKVLVADLDQPEKTAEFADMFAQTLAYGLFSARVMATPSPSQGEGQGEGRFTRQKAQRLIPKTNPFLRDFFYQITGPQLDDEPYVSFVDDLAALLAHTNMPAVLADFGKRTRQEDPVVHFYETFLAAYDPRLRELRGVYYTPEPVVSYIVRSVDALLKDRFNCPQGLADTATVTVRNHDPGHTVKGTGEMRKTGQSHKVLILDPAAGTGTFLYAVVDHIRQQYMTSGNAGLWSGYVSQHLLPRLFGFELLMAPYAVAHFKLALQLAGYDLAEAQRALWAYDFAAGERIRVYLTNALEGPHEYTGLPLFTQFLADETNAANQIKQDWPIMVVLGNPPYSGHSANASRRPDGSFTFIGDLLQSYYQVDGQPLGERNPKWLQDDYVKFIRFGQWRIERTGAGILALVTNHGYLDNPTFRGMRQQLMNAFTRVYILNLHGNAKKRETAPDGSPDGNVFDIQQGVAIGIFVKEPGQAGPAQVYHADLWGTRERKYERLFAEDVQATAWEPLVPRPPFYLFVPQDTDLLAEYERGWKVTDIFPVNSVGIVTARDNLTIRWSPEEVWDTVRDFARLPPEEAREKYSLGQDAQDWKVHLAQADVQSSGPDPKKVTPILYRPFDVRFTYYTGQAGGFIGRPRPEVMQHMLAGKNIGLHLCRQVISDAWRHVLATNSITDDCYVSNRTRERGYTLPLYLYGADKKENRVKGGGSVIIRSLFESQPGYSVREPNLSPPFIAAVKEKLSLDFVRVGRGDWQTTFGPEDVFHYIYAVLHAPTYRARYAEFLKMDFPRVPLTADRALFRALAEKGAELVALHLLEAPAVAQVVTRYPVPGESEVARGYLRYVAPGQRAPGTEEPLAQGRVYTNQAQYFEGVAPEVWAFQVGGYQVLEKWLKDRKGRRLLFDDLLHYQKIVVAMKETLRLMAEIDEVIPAWPIE